MKIAPASRRIGVLLSGRGSNLTAIADRIAAGSLEAEIALVISNKETAPGLVEARKRGLDAVFLPSVGRSREEFDQEAVNLLRDRKVALVCLAGFMRVLSPVLVRAFPQAILNIHPALLPAFPGLDVQKAGNRAWGKIQWMHCTFCGRVAGRWSDYQTSSRSCSEWRFS